MRIDIIARYCYFHVISKKNIIVEAPDIAKWTLGKTPVEVMIFYMNRKFQVRMNEDIVFDPER